jgi:hypothetical protein
MEFWKQQFQSWQAECQCSLAFQTSLNWDCPNSTPHIFSGIVGWWKSLCRENLIWGNNSTLPLSYQKYSKKTRVATTLVETSWNYIGSYGDTINGPVRVNYQVSKKQYRSKSFLFSLNKSDNLQVTITLYQSSHTDLSISLKKHLAFQLGLTCSLRFCPLPSLWYLHWLLIISHPARMAFYAHNTGLTCKVSRYHCRLWKSRCRTT